MSTRSISFTEHHDDLIETKLNSGHYKNASEVVRDAMRALEHREAEEQVKLEALRTAVRKGMDAYERGEYVTFDSGHEVSAYFNERKSKKTKR